MGFSLEGEGDLAWMIGSALGCSRYLFSFIAYGFGDKSYSLIPGLLFLSTLLSIWIELTLSNASELNNLFCYCCCLLVNASCF